MILRYLFTLLAFVDTQMVSKITLAVAIANFVFNPNPGGRMISLMMCGVLVAISKWKRHADQMKARLDAEAESDVGAEAAAEAEVVRTDPLARAGGAASGAKRTAGGPRGKRD